MKQDNTYKKQYDTNMISQSTQRKINKNTHRTYVESLQIQLKESLNEQLMNKQKQRKKQKKYKQRNQFQENSDKNQDQYCYPKFLSCLGTFCTPIKIFCPCCVCLFCCCQCCGCNLSNPLFQQIPQKVGLIQRFGQYKGSLQPGLHIINPISQKVIQVSLQTKMLNFNQIAFTKDNVQFNLQTIIFYRVVDPQKLVYRLGVSQFQIMSCVGEIAQGFLRSLIGQSQLQQVIQKRQLVGKKLKQQMNEILFDMWGVYIESASIKNMRLNPDIQNILSSVAKTKRYMQAMLISYKADIQVAKMLKQMSNILDSKAAFQIRYLNMVGDIINNQNQKMIIINTVNKEDLLSSSNDKDIESK